MAFKSRSGGVICPSSQPSCPTEATRLLRRIIGPVGDQLRSKRFRYGDGFQTSLRVDSLESAEQVRRAVRASGLRCVVTTYNPYSGTMAVLWEERVVTPEAPLDDEPHDRSLWLSVLERYRDAPPESLDKLVVLAGYQLPSKQHTQADRTLVDLAKDVKIALCRRVTVRHGGQVSTTDPDGREVLTDEAYWCGEGERLWWSLVDRARRR